MRHRVYGRKLGRNKNERNSLFKSLMQELFLHGTITTSIAKASAIKGQVDNIINLAKNKTSQRLIQSFFSNKLLQERIINEIAPKLSNRNSGYTSFMKVKVQEGDRTILVKMSLIGLEELKPFPAPSLRAKAKQSSPDKISTKIAPLPTAPRNDKKRVVSKRKVVKKA